MEKANKRAYVYHSKCTDSNKLIPKIYYTLPDFGDAPILKKCKFCDTLYWYTLEDEFYIQPLEKQIEGMSCEICNANLSEALVPTHTYIKCCNTVISLDDNFADSVGLDNGIMEDIEVFLLY